MYELASSSSPHAHVHRCVHLHDIALRSILDRWLVQFSERSRASKCRCVFVVEVEAEIHRLH
jgi:hypothetical protein